MNIPMYQIDALTASAFVQFFCRDWNKDTIVFETRKSGTLTVARKGDLLEMDFPSRPLPVTRLISSAGPLARPRTRCMNPPKT